jgi:hypothetical protein
MTIQIFNANDILSGRVVYLTKDGGWSEQIADAVTFETPEDEARLKQIAEAAFEARQVVDVVPIDVSVENGSIRPLVYRERVRAQGPSVRTDLGKQAGNF